ncbi:hypothetical protein EGW08_018153 [Elysia chlorotica]|uniref:Uncharacterized protein n=1 Tax=Elysia chlorotica TaxID=188477 RepID=A0A433SY48_ELYCH|nr:hypothetical protein EGW08_018153 [Elysia chlorotica]
MRSCMNHLWCNVVRGSTECSCRLVADDVLLAHAKVCNFDVTLRVQHDIVQLEISGEIESLYISCGNSADLRCDGLLELALLLYSVHQISAVHILHHKVKAVLEQTRCAGVQLHQERRFVRQGQDSLLDHRALHVVVLNDDVFLENLDCIELVRAFPLS